MRTLLRPPPPLLRDQRQVCVIRLRRPAVDPVLREPPHVHRQRQEGEDADKKTRPFASRPLRDPDVERRDHHDLRHAPRARLVLLEAPEEDAADGEDAEDW